MRHTRFADWIRLRACLGPALAFLAVTLVTAGQVSGAHAQDAAAGTLPAKLAGHGGPIMAVAVDPASKRVLTASFDYSIIFHNLTTGGETIVHRLFGHEAAVNDVAFVPGSDLAISVSDDGSFAIWDLEKGSLVKRFTDTPDKVLDLDVSDDGRLAAIARWDGTARVFSISEQREIARLEGHRGNVNAVAFSADAATLYTASYDGTIRAWDLADAKEKAMVHDHGWGVNVLARHAGALVFGGLDGTLARVDIASRESVEMAKSDRPVLSLNLSADGSRLAAGFGDGHIRIFRTEDWSALEDYDTAYGPVWGLDFADAGGNNLYHSGLDDFAILWQVDPRKPFDRPQGVYPRRFQMTADMSVGERQFQRKCSVCHTLERDGGNRAGPTLYKLFGRKAGSVPGYPYSDSLRNSGIVWTEQTVAKLFDEGPDIITPGSKMPLQRLKNIEDRDALIAFLKTATDPEAGFRQGDIGQ
ncbi:MAG TPA: c-type cytochrome [Afifellaceae bacterium]|nr:c-type cytochrome [Afifellaceae bacterium]